jgi:hypothetical protein
VLPKIYQELRENEDVEEDREKYKQKLKTTLKLSLHSIEPHKNPIDMIENSKKIYSEYCKYNLTKPLDMSNIESVLKQTINGSNQTANHSQANLSGSSNKSKDYSIGLGTGKKLKSLLVESQTVTIKNLNEINMEMKKRKSNLAKTMSKYESYMSNLYNYHTHSQSFFNPNNRFSKNVILNQKKTSNSNYNSKSLG